MNESFAIETKKVSLLTGIFSHFYIKQIFIILLFGCTSPCQKNQNEVNEKLYTIDVESIIDKNKDITLSLKIICANNTVSFKQKTVSLKFSLKYNSFS